MLRKTLHTRQGERASLSITESSSGDVHQVVTVINLLGVINKHEILIYQKTWNINKVCIWMDCTGHISFFTVRHC